MNLTELSKAELKQYLSDNRNDDEKFSAALQELMNPNSDAPVYPPMNWKRRGKSLNKKSGKLTEKNKLARSRFSHFLFPCLTDH